MNTLLSTKAIAWSAIVIATTGCPSTEPASSRTDQPAPASTSPAPASTNLATVSGELLLHVDGLTCEGCAWQIRDTLEKVDGVQDVRTTVASKRVVVTYDSAKTSPADIQRALRTVGYEATATEGL